MSEQNYIERYWRDATPEDAIKEPPMVARFRSCEDGAWFVGSLEGFRRNHLYCWYSTNLGSHKHCQVYDAPDPGEGWRLIDTAKESWHEEDEYLHPDKVWRKAVGGIFFMAGTYRRRIAPPKPKYEPFRWEDREQLRGRLVTYVFGDRTVEFRCESFAVDDGGFSVHHIYSDWLCKNAVFVDTKELVGRRVE